MILRGTLEHFDCPAMDRSATRGLAKASARHATAAKRRIYIIDPDRAVCEALGKTFTALGYDVRVAGSAAAFASAPLPDINCCVLVDVSFRDQSGFDLLRHLQDADAIAEIVFMTAHADISMAVNAMKRGAVDFLTKPLRMSELLPAVDTALVRSAHRRDGRRRRAQFSASVALLTPREKEVLALVLQGKRNKQIADALASQESTVKVHRSRLMRKLGVRTLADLLRAGAQFDADGRAPSLDPARNGHAAFPVVPGTLPRFDHAPLRSSRSQRQ